ncbi:MAG: hypothetical protein KatS3mg017_0405 [Fimbriimonadales bacterium]|nr:MAG: hypothetical protein KatS3mg017_0405 [Fimbriimonadales bacterium]
MAEHQTTSEPFDIVKYYGKQRGQRISPREAWQRTKDEFIKHCSQDKDAEQAWKSTSGRALEKIVEQEFLRQIKSARMMKTIHIQHWNAVSDSRTKQILSEQLWLRGELREPVMAESEVDFVAMEIDQDQKPTRVVAVYSCKASLRERFQQDLYWAEKFRGRGIRFCLITLDNDGILCKSAESGELTTKQAKMAAALYDRIYLFCDEQIKHHKRIFRPIREIVRDLKKWLKADL